ncbi:MAG: DegT/DnrJ/EryC1/StrS family aminotransferase [Geitlerinemataceae cyanobacterium]
MHDPLEAEFAAAIARVLERGDFILGKDVREFEAAFAEATGVAHGVGVASGTDAIALGLQACGVEAGDEVIVPANTFIATVIGAIHAGARPVLVDCDLATGLIDLDAAEAAITPKTKAIVPVHLYGQVVSPRRLLEISERHGVTIFEDAAQAHLADRDGYTAGTIGKAAAYSFYPAKNLGAFGNGGIVLTRDSAVADKVRSLRNYGAPKKYLHVEHGTNSRLDTIQAAILNVKLPHLREWNRDRNACAAEYDRLLAPLADRGIVPMRNDSGGGHIYHLYVLHLSDRAPLDRDALASALQERNISTGIHYPIPCHRQPGYLDLGYPEGAFPNAEALCGEILSLPMFPGLGLDRVETVCTAIEEIIATCG